MGQPARQVTDSELPVPGGADELLDISSFIPALITLLANRLMSSATATFKALFGIGSLEFRVLAFIATEMPTHGRRISEAIGIDKAAISRTISSLTAAGLVCAITTRERGRRQEVTLTKAGRELHDRALAVARERERLLVANLSPAERQQLIGLCRRMLAQIPNVAKLAR